MTPVGVALASVTEPIDTATPAGRLFFNMLGSFAEFERDMITKRLDGGRRTRAAQGKKASGGIPYGYTQNVDGMAGRGAPTSASLLRNVSA